MTQTYPPFQELSMSTVKQVTNWGLVSAPADNPYQAPEQILWSIVGEVDGQQVVLPIDKPANGNFISQGVEYELGEPHPEMKAISPGVREKMKARFMEP
jgi:hypothetical protein